VSLSELNNYLIKIWIDPEKDEFRVDLSLKIKNPSPRAISWFHMNHHLLSFANHYVDASLLNDRVSYPYGFQAVNLLYSDFTVNTIPST